MVERVAPEIIENFLHGSNPKKYVVGIEASYGEPYVHLIINDPETGKRIEKHPYKPFLWFKEEVSSILFDGKKSKSREVAQKYGIKTKRLRISDANGEIPNRLSNGYRYIATCNESYNKLIQFFKVGGIDVFDKKYSKLFFMFTPVEQFMIQTGIRLFKGMEDYNDVHRFQFDLETEGLDPKRHSIFQIGMRDNRGFEMVLETTGKTAQERRDSERDNLINFFRIINHLKPDVISGYNSESFDWAFIYERCDRLSIPVNKIAICLDGKTAIKRKPSMLKLGNEQEVFEQTNMWGYNVIDIAHAVRRAQAINSDIKGWGLKYITKYSNVAKENRVYVQGDKIYSTWADKVTDYAFNETNGDYYKISDKMPLADGYKKVKGNYIVQRYLLDDLWETEQIDGIYNQAAFLISKLLPTSYSRSSTMGTASQWKLIMAAWSYENDLAIPETENKRDFTGGLSRLLRVGYARNVVKFDYAALYPKTELTHKIFPELDISGVMAGLLTYIVDTRDKFKFLTSEEKAKAKAIQKRIDEGKDTLSKEELEELDKQLKEHKALASLYDKKQLPLKILANSWFGAYGAPYIFNWGDTNCAEETTCRGRQYLRLMVRHFKEKYGFEPLVGDSVTHDTPVYVRNKHNKTIDILPISDLFNENSEFLDAEKLRDYEEKPYEVLTRNGWKNIKYVYRHSTDKNIHRITTKDRLINVTEDHSLFQNGIEVKPSTLKRGDAIDVYSIPSNINDNIMLTEDEAFLYGFFLGDGSSLCSKRKVKYKSKKTGEVKTYFSKRSYWKISNTNLTHLERLQQILKNSFNVNGLIKNHLISSGVYNLVVHNTKFNKLFCEQFYTSYREKKVPKFILNANLSIKKAFIEGVFASDGYGDTIEDCSDIGMKSQIAMAGISVLLNELDIDFKIKTRKDKENFILFSLKNKNRNNSSFTDKTKKKTNEVWKNEIVSNKDTNNYVYDISTEDGTFICGINGIIAHNTDGFNFAFPDNIDEVKYVAKGSHWKTKNDAGKELSGLDAVLAEFNENFMTGKMGLDIDDIYESTINFSRKNYANLLNDKLKLVGNSIKSKKMPVYIEDFLSKAIRLLLDGKGKEFITYYQDYVDKIYNYNIPLVKIASKSKVKSTISDYKKKATKKNKAGNPMPKQAHMELAILNDLNVNLGDTIYYVNTGKSKTDGDCQTLVRAKMTKKQLAKYEAEHGHAPTFETKTILNCKLLDTMVVETNLELIKDIESLQKMLAACDPSDNERIEELNAKIQEMESSLLTDEYNVAKYLEAFNKKVKPLLVCFKPEIRGKILRQIKKDKKTKLEKLTEKYVFTEQQCELISGMPEKPTDQDDYYEDLMKMEDKEIRFWDSVEKVPNNMSVDEWEVIRADYHERKRIEREEGIKAEKELFEQILKRLELKEIRLFESSLTPPQEILIFATLSDDYMTFVSRKWGVELGSINDIFKYEEDAVERDMWYQLNSISDDNRYQLWLDYKSEQNIMSVEAQVKNEMKKEISNIHESIDLLKKHVEEFEEVVLKTQIEKTKKSDDEEDDDDEYNPEAPEPEIDGYIPELQKADFEIEMGSLSSSGGVAVDFVEVPIITKRKSPWDDEIGAIRGENDYAKELLKNLKDLPKEENDEWNF